MNCTPNRATALPGAGTTNSAARLGFVGADGGVMGALDAADGGAGMAGEGVGAATTGF